MRLFWALIILTCGLVLLGQNFNLWGANQIEELTQYWPLLLILFGIAIMVRHLKFGWLIILGSFILALGFIYFVSFSPTSSRNQFFNREAEISNFSSNIEGAKKAKIIIDTGAVALTITDSSQKLIEGTLESRYSEPQLDVSSDGDITIAHLKTVRFGGLWGKNILDVRITNQIPVELVINSGASSIDLDLENINISGLDINAGASSIEIKLGKVQDKSRLNISAGASSINITLPKDLGVKIISKTGLSSKEFQGFNQVDKETFQNENYTKEGAIKTDLGLDAGVSSIKLQNY